MSCEFVDKSWQAEATDEEVSATSGMGEGSGEITFADAGRSGDEDVEMLSDPGELGECTLSWICSCDGVRFRHYHFNTGRVHS
jgi:hypothetical protein